MSEQTQDYANDFDPEWYIKAYVDNNLINVNDKAYCPLLHCLETFHEFFATGEIKGHRLLDVGSGPTVYSVISASDHVAEIYLSDLNAENRRILSDWLAGERNLDALSFQYIVDKQNYESSVSEKQAKVRSCVRAVLPIDIIRDKPFPIENDAMKFDIITSSFCLESASRSLDEYKECVKNVISLLKPGGIIILAGFLEATGYLVGKHWFRTQFVSKEEVLNAFKAAGVEILKFEEQDAIGDSLDNFKSIFVMLGKTKE